jgi:hypothetical protein
MADRATASNLDTLPAEGRPRVRMLLSFQRPSHLFRKADSFPSGRAESTENFPVLGRTDEYSAGFGMWKPSLVGVLPPASSRPRTTGRATAGAPYETSWTVTVRCRGRSSKSSRTTCCQVPSASLPSTTGIVSEGPITAALRCAWALVS